jgi:hypothetical protein
LFDPWGFLSPKRRRRLDEGWPGLFREHLLEELPVEQMRPFFREDFGRPTKELHTVLGVLLFQQAMDLSDPEAIDQLSYNLQWHYALDIVEESDEAKTISEKTLWSMRQRMIQNGLEQEMFERIADKLATVFGVDTAHQRIDSVHIRSNMRRLGRIGIVSQTIYRFLVNLKRHHRDLFDTVSSEMVARYWGKKAQAAFSLVKPSESAKTLLRVSADLFDLVEAFKDQPAVCEMYTYRMMQRVLADQCHIQTNADGGKAVTLKRPAEIASDSLQNPSDPDATYDAHKGQGYQVQIMETFTPGADETQKDPRLNLITHVSVQSACEHDTHALVPAIADTKVRGVGPQKALADTHYGSDANHAAARVAKVELIAPTNDGAEKSPLSDFGFDEKGLVTRCPTGRKPERVSPRTKTSNYGAAFDLERCKACPLLPQCPVKPGKRRAYLRYSEKRLRLALRRAFEKTQAFIDIYRWRAGIEATMSQYDRLTGVKQLRVRGMDAVRFYAVMKAAGLNLLRAARVRKVRAKAQRAHRGRWGLLRPLFVAVKDRLNRWDADCQTDAQEYFRAADYHLKVAA